MYEKCRTCLNICTCCQYEDSDVCLSCRPFGSKFTTIKDVCEKDGSSITRFKFNIGDRVRIRNDLNLLSMYKMDFEPIKSTRVTSDMYDLRGEIAAITNIKYNRYIIDKDYGGWCWTDEMFECKVE